MASSNQLDLRRLLGLLGVMAAVLIWAEIPKDRPVSTSPRLVVDPNTAPGEVLAALPNLGPARVRAIEAARIVAPFRSATDMDRRIKGIGPATIGELKPFLRFEPSLPSQP